MSRLSLEQAGSLPSSWPMKPQGMLRGCLPIRQGCILVQFCCYDNQREEALGKKCGQQKGTTAPLEFGTTS